MDKLYCFVAQGDTLFPQVLRANQLENTLTKQFCGRYEPARNYQSVLITEEEWDYPPIGMVHENASSVDWPALWSAAFNYLITERGVPPKAAAEALKKTEAHGLAGFVSATGKVVFGVPVEEGESQTIRKENSAAAGRETCASFAHQRGVAAAFVALTVLILVTAVGFLVMQLLK